jgi:hypothetical protein
MPIPVRNIDAFGPPKESFRMRSDMSNAAPPISHARAKGVALSCVLFEKNFIGKPMAERKDQSIPKSMHVILHLIRFLPVSCSGSISPTGHVS